MVFTHRKLCAPAVKRRQIVPGACRTELLAKIVLKKLSWGAFFEGLALSWASLGRLLFALGRLLASLGHFLGVSWALLGRSWLSLGCSVELHGCISVPRTVPGLDFKGFGDVSD